jgi:hypothetical protein
MTWVNDSAASPSSEFDANLMTRLFGPQYLAAHHHQPLDGVSRAALDQDAHCPG